MDRPKRATRNPNPTYRVLGGESGRVKRTLGSEECQYPAQVCGNDVSSETPASGVPETASTPNKRKVSRESQGGRKKVSRMTITPRLLAVAAALKETVEAFQLMDMKDEAERIQGLNRNTDYGEPPVLEDMRLTAFADYPQKQAQVFSSPGGSEDKARNEKPDCSVGTNAMSMNKTDVEQPLPVPENDYGLESGNGTMDSTSTTSNEESNKFNEVLTKVSGEYQAGVESSTNVRSVERNVEAVEENIGISDARYAEAAEVDGKPAVAILEPAGLDVEPAKVDGKPAGLDVEPAEVDGKPAGLDVEPAEVDGKPIELDVEPPVAEIEPAKADSKNTKKKCRVRIVPQIIELYKMLEARDRENK